MAMTPRQRPRVGILALWICAAPLILASSGCWGGGDDSSASTPRVHDGPLSVRPLLLASEPTAEPSFACTANRKGEEVVDGPSIKTNLDEARVVRTTHGICVVFEFPNVGPRPGLPPPGVLLLTFFRHGDESTSAEGSTSLDQRSVQIKAYNDPTYQQPGEYLLSNSAGPDAADSVTLGRLGIGSRTVSVLVTKPKFPDWVLDKDTTWRAQIL